MISEHKIEQLQAQFGFDRLTAWRHLRDQTILRRRYRYQERVRIYGKW